MRLIAKALLHNPEETLRIVCYPQIQGNAPQSVEFLARFIKCTKKTDMDLHTEIHFENKICDFMLKEVS